MTVQMQLILAGDEARATVRTAASEADLATLQETEIAHFDGTLQETLLSISAAASSCALLLKSLYPYYSARRVRMIKIGDIEIVDPRDEDVSALIRLLEEDARES